MLFFVLCLQIVNYHIDYHEGAHSTLSGLIEATFSKEGFDHEVERSQLWKQLGLQHCQSASKDAVVSVEGYIYAESGFVVSDFQNWDACENPLHVLEGLDSEQPLLDFITKHRKFDTRIKY